MTNREFTSILPELESLYEAARAISSAQAVLINTGAGMSAESGVPTYRGRGGRWREFTPFTSKGVIPSKIADPVGYREQFERATAFHEYFRRLMWDAEPHAGYDVITRWVERGMKRGMSQGDQESEGSPPSFVLTTNIDDLHRRSGVPNHLLYERYGNLWELQCLNPEPDSLCARHSWRLDQRELCALDMERIMTSGHPPCLFCGGPARPRIQMKHDHEFIEDEVGWRRYQDFMERVDVCVVIGTCLWLSWPDGVERPRVIHINPDPDTHKRYEDPIAITLGAKQALQGIDWFLERFESERSVSGEIGSE